MELVQPAPPWRLARYFYVTRERVVATLAATRWLGSPGTLRPSQVVSTMSDEWMLELERFEAAHGGDGW
jgi:hypothetical protein